MGMVSTIEKRETVKNDAYLIDGDLAVKIKESKNDFYKSNGRNTHV